ncbi:heparan-alpha-glucosaminide N-acetyltransferase domain-containing protein [uncultured Microbacterium sp.]|uniref:heparan-alpha-glucosaminide N-acetyltransferase domain-containing protein n=1 Tax=uncultured Microbacterium sp. TaxID=191216 RepID=UPI0028D1BEE6|nr:heparan-alpha-glucosaminide N-acetyltransferase domain-containing protein [uncultured Microbacterium sp.]
MSVVHRPTQWFHDFGRAPRILGLDVARGLAILGMVGAHIGESTSFDALDPSTWGDLVNGRSSILFAVLAGVSVALMTGRSAGPDPARIPSIRLQLVGRGAVIFLIGVALELLNTPIAVILTLYGLLYVSVIPFLRWPPWKLVVAAVVLALVGPALLALMAVLALHPSGPGIDLVLYGSYPITVWLAFVFAGMALGRLHVERLETAAATLAVGLGLMVVGYGLGLVGALAGLADSAEHGGATPSSTGWSTYPDAVAAGDPLGAVLAAVFGVDPHSGGTAEILGSGGFALVIIALCVLLSRPLRWPLLPLAALGSMPLSAYSAHVLSTALIGGPGGFFTSNEFWAATAIMLLLATTLWSMLVGRGPLERLAGSAAAAMAAPPAPGAPRLEA